MKLTGHAVWQTYAGGTFAAPDRYSYDVKCPLGRYLIEPISHERNSNRHLGYRVYFLNEKGLLPGGLWQPLVSLTTLPQARRLCQEHLEQHHVLC